MNEDELREIIEGWLEDYGIEGVEESEVQNLVDRFLESPAGVDTH